MTTKAKPSTPKFSSPAEVSEAVLEAFKKAHAITGQAQSDGQGRVTLKPTRFSNGAITGSPEQVETARKSRVLFTALRLLGYPFVQACELAYEIEQDKSIMSHDDLRAQVAMKIIRAL